MVLGEAQYMNGEDASRSTFELPGDQQKLLEAVSATGKPVVLLLMGARPMELRWAKEHVPAIMDIWYPGTRGGQAVANLLLGTVSPGGKLPFSWPRNVGQVPLYYGRTLNHQKPEDLDKRYWNEPSSPLYPFGYGLSYSSFTYSNLKVHHPSAHSGGLIKVSVDLANTGKVKADETAQLYIHQQYGSAARPIRELKGFQRVALRAGEKRTLQFTLGPDELRYWSSAAKGWVLEASSFDVWVGSDSTAALHTTFEITR
jgi:beta-glucosidase